MLFTESFILLKESFSFLVQQASESVQIDVPTWALPVITDLKQFISTASWLVGGLFGLYLIYLIFQLQCWYKFNKNMKEMNKTVKEMNIDIKAMKNRIEEIEEHMNQTDYVEKDNIKKDSNHKKFESYSKSTNTKNSGKVNKNG